MPFALMPVAVRSSSCTLAVQLAHARGAEIYATAGARDVDFVRGLGAQTVIDYRTERFEVEG